MPNPKQDTPVPLTGAEALVHTLIGGGITTCFANPGTSEMHFVAALDRIAGIRCVLGLQENVVTGMADGYFRVTRKPAVTLLHCGPGLANGFANLHNARRGGAGVVNIVGDHALAHVAFDSPLTSDVAGIAAACSDWVATAHAPQTIGGDAARAVQAAGADHGHVATLILPADVSWSEGAAMHPPLPPIPPAPVDALPLKRAVAAVRGGKRVLMVLGGAALVSEAHPMLAALQAAGVDMMSSPVAGRIPVGRGRLAIRAVPYVVDVALEALRPYDHVILVNCPPPTAFFLYPGKPSLVSRPDAETITLAREDQDGLGALAALMGQLGLTPCDPAIAQARPAPEAGAITPDSLAAVICSLMPEDAIVVSEALTQGVAFPAHYPTMPACDLISVVGGAIGGGLPAATGAAIGAADLGQGERRVVSLQADGSAAYTLQALWTQAREALPCTTLILNNQKYEILLGEYAKVGAAPGQVAYDMLSLDRPALDWVALAQGFGVAAVTVRTIAELRAAFIKAITHAGPMLIDVRMT